MSRQFYGGYPLDSSVREVAVEFTVPIPDDAVAMWPKAVELPERDLIVTLQHGQRFPDKLKRGMPVRFDMTGGYVFVGHVKYRRMNRLVCTGRFE